MDWFLKFCQKTNKKYLDGNYYNLLFQPNHICSNGKYQLTDSLCNVCKVKEDYDHIFFFMSSKY